MSDLTIRDIARMAGVSTTAVSFVLNDRPGVSDATREKVREIIRRTGFTPNVHTRRLNLGKSYTVQVVLNHYDTDMDLFNQFALETLSSIFTVSKSLGYSVTLTFADGSMNTDQIMDSVRNKDCDGVILIQLSDPAMIARLLSENIPFVCVDAHTDLEVPLVGLDYYDASYQATAYLHSMGHTRIGFIGTRSPSVYYRHTFGGYAAALRDAGLSCDPAWLAEVHGTEEFSMERIRQLLQLPQLPTAFLCAGDVFAVYLMRCAKLQGLRIPEDISIMSLDDLLISRYMDPPLSTMTFPKEQLGEQAMRLLYRIIQGEDYRKINLIKTTPVIRETVRKL